MQIDFDFLEKLEGKGVLKGYVPTNKGVPIGNSGVTISTGIDLGQMDNEELMKLLRYYSGYSELMFKLSPYTGLKKYQAIGFLREHPLEITQQQSDMLYKAMVNRNVARLARLWIDHTSKSFFSLPKEVQTVLFSLAWNFGTALDVKLPSTWKAFVNSFFAKDWTEAYETMRDFPSANPELSDRRSKEAEYLRKLLPSVN